MTCKIFACCISCFVVGGLSIIEAVEEIDFVKETGISSFMLPAVFEQLKAKDPTGKGMSILFTVTDAEGKPAANQKLQLRSFDLAEDFPAGDLRGLGGYSTSFCFWPRIEEEHGPELIGNKQPGGPADKDGASRAHLRAGQLQIVPRENRAIS